MARYIICPRERMCSRNRIGPKMEPWGTPHDSPVASDVIWFAKTLNQLPERQQENQSETDPDIPTRSRSLLIIILWSTVLQADRRSNKTKTLCLPESADIIMSLETLSKAVSVECILWKPDWIFFTEVCCWILKGLKDSFCYWWGLYYKQCAKYLAAVRGSPPNQCSSVTLKSYR